VGNPYSVSLPISDLDYALSSQGQQFLTGKTDVATAIPAGGSKTLGVPVKVSFSELIEAVKDARPGSTIPYHADLGLSADTPVFGTMRLPMAKDGQIDIPTTQTLLNKLQEMAR